MPETTYAWAPITKTEKQADGTLMVYGPAASSDLDRDQQRLNADWLDRAMPEWAQTGNIREQHDSKRAVGVGVGLTKTDDGKHHIAAHIVDPVAVLKIETKVLKGFSVGIKGPRVALGKADAPGGEIVDGSICEISVVDRPCNPNTLFEIAKADGAGDLSAVDNALVVEKSDAEAFGLPQELYDRLATPVKEALAALAAGGATVTAEAAKSDTADEEPVVVNVTVQGTLLSEDALLDEVAKADLSAAGRKKAAASGAAMPDGSYPITTKADLRKAIKAVGRGGADHDKIRAHIVKRAKALGLEALVPENWNADGSLKDAAKTDDTDATVPAETIAKAEQVLRDVRALVPSLTKADDENGDSPDESGDIAGAEQAIAVIAKLIIAEAESLAMGNLNEAMDISLLLDAVRSLTWFKCREENEQNDDGDADAMLADQPDITKTDAPAAPAVEPVPPTSDANQTPDTLTKADITELVKAAVAEATEAAKERETALAADLVKAQQAIEEFRALPIPGGPALTRTADQHNKARTTDADRMRHEAKALLAKADGAVDPVLRKGYTDRANELLEKADA